MVGKEGEPRHRLELGYISTKKKTRDEKILEYAGLRVAKEKDSYCRCLKNLEKPRPLLLRPTMDEGGRAWVLVLIPKPEREEDNTIL